MSRIGNKPVSIPDGVKVQISGQEITVEGKLGKLTLKAEPAITLEQKSDTKTIVVKRIDNERQSRALHGLTRALIQNMVVGVTKGYEKKLEVVGVGYLAAIAKQILELRVGFANEIHVPIPAGLTVVCPDQTHIHIKGIDKQLVGQFAAAVRATRKPEPYKGKGIRYEGEHVRRKAGKATTK